MNITYPLRVFFVIAMMLFGVSGVAFAQDAAVVAPRIGVQNCLMSQENGTITITCKFVNSGDSQSDLHYAVMLTTGNSDEEGIVDYKVYDDVLALQKGQILEKAITYTVPSYINGTVTVWLRVHTSEGLPLVSAKVGVTSHTATGDAVTIDPDSCFLTVAGSPHEIHYTPRQGVDVQPTEKLLAHCTVTNNGGNLLTLTPAFNTYRRSVFGAHIDTPQVTNAPITIPPGKSAPYVFGVPHATEPQAYDTVATLAKDGTSITNPILFHYVIQGVSATVQMVTVEKSAFKAGEVASITALWTGAADTFYGSRGAGSNTPVLFISAVVSSQGVSCGEVSQPASNNAVPTPVALQVPLTKDCENPTVTVRLLDAGNQTIAEKSIPMPPPNTGDTAPQTTTGFSLAKYIWYIGGTILAVVVISGVLVYLRRNRKLEEETDIEMTTPLT